MSPSPFCDHAVEEPAISIAATSASPTNRFCNSSGLCHLLGASQTRTMKSTGISDGARESGAKTGLAGGAGWILRRSPETLVYPKLVLMIELDEGAVERETSLWSCHPPA